jgi:hypothetical protein
MRMLSSPQVGKPLPYRLSVAEDAAVLYLCRVGVL